MEKNRIHPVKVGKVSELIPKHITKEDISFASLTTTRLSGRHVVMMMILTT